MVEEAERSARARGALRVTRVTASVGSLSGIVPELLLRAFEVARGGTLLGEADLQVDVERALARCPTCGAESEFEDYALICSACGGIGLEVLSGTRIVLTRLEMEVDDSMSAAGGEHV